MKHDEFAFFNQQLAAMLKEGIPLEGALRQLCENMRQGALRSEMELLEADLKNGTPLATAVAARQLPEFYVRMVQVGVQGNDLTGMLTLLADYYQRVDSTWTRLKGLMFYPLVILIAAFGLSCFLTMMFNRIIGSDFYEIMGVSMPRILMVNIWAPPILTGTMLAILLFVLLVPSLGRKLRWRLPAFREAELAQVASTMALMLKSGGNLSDSISLVQQLEKNSPASAELAQWQKHLAEGRGKFSEMAVSGRAFPPLFIWLVGNAGEDIGAGFARAADIYSARAIYRTDMFLYTVLPCSILLLGAMIACQIFPVIRTFTGLLNDIGS